MDNIKVSVIVPVFNQEKYISRCLDSITGQDFDGFEVIVIDDGSTDNSFRIISDKLEGCGIPHKIIRQENRGVSYSRNVGISKAKGDYIAFVDGDDYISKNHLSQLYNGKTDFSLTQLVKKDKSNLSNPHYYPEDEMHAEDFIALELQMKIPFSFVQLLYKRDLIAGNDLKFSADFIYGEDTEFALKALSYGESIKISNEITYFYIQHENSSLSTSKLKRFEFITALEDLADFYRKNNMDNLANLVVTSRIPKAIFGNMNYFFHNNYDFDEVIAKMNELKLFEKLSRFKGSPKFAFKIRLFLLAPKLYYKVWMKFKNSI